MKYGIIYMVMRMIERSPNLRNNIQWTVFIKRTVAKFSFRYSALFLLTILGISNLIAVYPSTCLD